MDVFKLAFETTVVGLLTLGWLGVATYLLFPDFQLDSVVQMLPDFAQKNLTTVGVGALILVYCLGSAILPISNQLVNDEHWPLNESAIRCQVFTKHELNLESIRETALSALPKEETFSITELSPRHCSYWAPVFTKDIRIQLRVHRFLQRWIGLPTSPGEDLTGRNLSEIEKICKTSESTKCDEFKAKRILTIFQQQETTVLSQLSDKTERLRQLHERIVVLRGTIFSLFVLLLICLFAYFARADGGAAHWIRPTCGALLGVAFTVFATINGYHDLVNPDIFDIPVLECLLVVITLFGVALAVRRTKHHDRFQSKRYVLITLFFTGLAYGGWMWSEVIYDQQVISSFVVLQHNPSTSK
jgi:hypothetical protein